MPDHLISPTPITIKAPQGPLKGAISLPLSKSESNRLQIIRFLKKSLLHPDNISESGDSIRLKSLLNVISQNVGNQSDCILDVGDAGTVMRFLTALCAVVPGQWVLTGNERMKQRPIGPLVLALRQIGARLSYLGQPGYPPLLIQGNEHLEGGHCEIDASVSSQFISALMMVAPLTLEGIRISRKSGGVSLPYIHLTAKMLVAEGAKVDLQDETIRVWPEFSSHIISPWTVKADWGASAFWFGMVALVPGSELLLLGLRPHSYQADEKARELFKRLGVASRYTPEGLWIMHSEGRSGPFNSDFTHYPDLAQAIGVCCACLEKEALLTGLASLRIKETDRIQAMQQELTGLGFEVQSGNDWIHIAPAQRRATPEALSAASYHDHRMVMSLSIATLLGLTLTFDDGACVQKSYPGFWQQLIEHGFQVY